MSIASCLFAVGMSAVASSGIAPCSSAAPDGGGIAQDQIYGIPSRVDPSEFLREAAPRPILPNTGS